MREKQQIADSSLNTGDKPKSGEDAKRNEDNEGIEFNKISNARESQLQKTRTFQDINADQYIHSSSEVKRLSHINYQRATSMDFTNNPYGNCYANSANAPGLEDNNQNYNRISNLELGKKINLQSNYPANKFNQNEKNNLVNPNNNISNPIQQQRIPNYSVNPQHQTQISYNLPTVLGSNYHFSYDKYLASDASKNQNQNDNKKHGQFLKNIENKIDKDKEEDIIEKMLNQLKQPAAAPIMSDKGHVTLISSPNTKKSSNQKEDSKAIKAVSSSDSNNPTTSSGVKKFENINDVNLKSNQNIGQAMEHMNPDNKKEKKTVKFNNLQTNMLKGFDLKRYKNLPSFDIPLQYNVGQNKGKFQKYFIEQAKAALNDIKKDDINSSIQKLELLLYYITNMQDN